MVDRQLGFVEGDVDGGGRGGSCRVDHRCHRARRAPIALPPLSLLIPPPITLLAPGHLMITQVLWSHHNSRGGVSLWDLLSRPAKWLVSPRNCVPSKAHCCPREVLSGTGSCPLHSVAAPMITRPLPSRNDRVQWRQRRRTKLCVPRQLLQSPRLLSPTSS